MPFTPRAQVQSVVQTTVVATEALLFSGASAGASSVVVSPAPDATSPFRSGVWIIIDAFTKEAEIRWISSVTGSTLSLNTALNYSHSAGDLLVPVLTDSVSAKYFGAQGDSVTDDQPSLQRALIECDRAGLWLHGDKLQYQITQPLFCNASHLKSIALRCQANAFIPIDTLGAAVTNCQNPAIKFTAAAATNTFTTATASGANANNLIAFNAPTGETLPGGIVAGRWYYVKTTPTSQTFTITATLGGAELDLTTDGTGWAYPDVCTLGRVFFDDVYIKGGTGNANLNILRVDVQQPGFTKDLRVDGPTGGGGVLFTLEGQISNHYNTELVGTSGCTCLKIGDPVDGVSEFSSGHGFHGINITSPSVTGTTIAISLVDTNAIEFTNLWTEGNYAIHMKLGDSTHSAIQTKVSNWMQSGEGTTVVQRDHPSTSLHVTGFAPYTIADNVLVDNLLSLTLTSGGVSDGRHFQEFSIPGGANGWPRFPNMVMGSYGTQTATGSLAGDLKIVARFLTPQDGLVTAFHAYFGSSVSNVKIKGVIYADSSDLPGALLATSDELTITSGTARTWQVLPFTTPYLMRGGTRYWIGWICDQTTLYAYWNQSPYTTGQGIALADTYAGGAADPFGTGSAQNVIPALAAVLE